ncbi:MAG: ABC transporter ATP-binding protein [Xanthobacteraceae bacterium]|nr:ABC transporter ATP-binding protein [Xanthobacteraceae bacterium]
MALENVCGGYGRTEVLRNVTLAVGEGEIVTILGANGAGKSTLLNSILGLLPRKTGRFTLYGRSIGELRTEEIVRQGICLVPERRQLFGSMTVEENLLIGAFVSTSQLQNRRRLTEQYARFPILQERRRQAARTMSGGQQQMLAIARGLMSAPKLLLLDEPSLGLAPLIVQQVFQEIQRLRDAGTTILLVEQNVGAALRIADRGYVMSGGRIVDERAPRDLLADRKVAEAYLGGADGDSMEQRIRLKAAALAGKAPITSTPDMGEERNR